MENQPPYTPAIRQEHHRADADRLVAALLRVKHFACSPHYAEGLWMQYSDEQWAAGWLGMPASDHDLVAAVLPYLPQPAEEEPTHADLLAELHRLRAIEQVHAGCGLDWAAAQSETDRLRAELRELGYEVEPMGSGKEVPEDAETGRTLFVCDSCGEEVGDGEQNNGCCPHCMSRALSPNGWCDDEDA